MKAIIVAAGMGRRLAPYTDDRPKTLVEVNGRSILQRQVDAYRAAGVDEIYIVRGYMKEKIVVARRALLRQRRLSQQQHPDVAVLRRAGDGRAAFCSRYSDIVFRPEVVRTAIETEGDYALVIDRRWHEAYVGRMNHPVEEGEVARVDDGRGHAGRQEDDAARARRPASSSGWRASPRAAAEQMRERFHQRRARARGQAVRARAAASRSRI